MVSSLCQFAVSRSLIFPGTRIPALFTSTPVATPAIPTHLRGNVECERADEECYGEMSKSHVNWMTHDARCGLHDASFLHARYATQMPGAATFWNRCGDATAEGG